MSEQKSPNGLRECRQRGFTLVEFGIVMIVTGLMVASLLSAYSAYLKKAKLETTYNRIFEVNDLIADSWRLENRYFCPADPTLKPGDAKYGVEDCASADGTTTINPTCTHGSTGVCVAVGLSVPGRSSNVLIGMIPFKTIAEKYNQRKNQLYSDLAAATDPDMKEEIRQAIERSKKVYSLSLSDLASDGWGNRLTYMVSAAWVKTLDDQVSKTWEKDYTVKDTQATLRTNGAIQVQDAQGQPLTKEGVRFALISHGENGSGSYTAAGTLVGGGCQGISATEQNNCDNDAVIVRTPLNSSNTDLKNDDIVAYNIVSSDDLWERVACGSSMCLRNKNSANVAIGNPSAISEKLTVEGLLRAAKLRAVTAAKGFCDTNNNCFTPGFIGGSASDPAHVQITDCDKMMDPPPLGQKYVAVKIGSTETKVGTTTISTPILRCDLVDLNGVYDQKCPNNQIFRGFDENNKAVCYDPCAVSPPVSLQQKACPSGMSGTRTYQSVYNCPDRKYGDYTTSDTCTPNPVNGTCGTSNGQSMNSSPDNNFCSIGQVSGLASSPTGWTWQCLGDNGGTNATCSATRRLNGMCGDSNGGVYDIKPSSGLCRMGAASSVNGSGPWDWKCYGSGGGIDVSCSASKQDPNATSCGGTAATIIKDGNSETRDPGGAGCADDKLTQIANTYEIRDTGPPGSNMHQLWLTYHREFVQTGCGDVPGTGDPDTTATLLQTFTGTFVTGTHQPINYTGANPQNVEYYGDQYVVSYQNCTVVAGICGTANNTGYTSAPQGNSLCNSGTATDVSGSGPWTWTCKGQSGGADSGTCTARLMTHGVCGGGNGGNFTTAPSGSQLCSSGTDQGMTATSSPAGWTWSCVGTNGGQTATCSAYKSSNGVCGSANGTTVSSQPSGGSLCNAGTSSAVTGGGPWNWTCNGTNGGSNANCSANKATTVNGACGQANGATRTSAPADNELCSSGSASAIGGTGPWTWSCYGYGLPAGTNASCTTYKTAPTNGVCGGSANTCTKGNPFGFNAGSCGGASTWSCVGTDGGSTASCSSPNAACAQNAVCGAGNNTCNIGNATGYNAGACGNSATWTCTGINGGNNASCSNPNPACAVNGSCGGSVMTCSIGSATNDGGQTACGTNRTWQCTGSNGGTTANCSVANAACPTPVAGSCGSSVMTCNAGNPISDGGQTSCGTSHTWQCQGLNGGSTANCSKANAACPTPVNGSCGSSGGCSSGTASSDNGATSCGTTRTWTCNGSNGGSSASCSQANAACAVPVNGACGSTKGTCTSGTVSGDNGDNTCDSTRMWSCVGSNGGSTASCAIDNIACGGGGGGGCFTGQTKFLMADGTYKEVSELKVGDKVKGQTGINTLERNDSFRVRSLLYRVNGSEAYVTANHPFYTKDGWKAVDYELARKEHPGMEITELKVGDVLVDEKGNEVELKSLEPEDHGWNTVYNPSFNGDHTYYAHGYLMHNILYQNKQNQ